MKKLIALLLAVCMLCGMMAGCASLFIATQPPGPRALPASTVAAVAQNDCTQTVVMEDAWEACRCAQAHTPKSGMVVICGSLYLAGEIRAHLEDDMSKNSKELQK